MRDPNSGLVDSNEKIHRQVSALRFQMFFAGLIFAVLSFILAHPIHIDNSFFKVIEIIALFCLLISGIILLAQLNKLWITGDDPKTITSLIVIRAINFINTQVLSKKRYYWIAFLVGMVLIVIDRSATILLS